MKILTQADVARLGAYRDIVEALREGFRAEIETPVRHHHDITDVATLLLMPAWSKDWAGLKTVVFKSDNAAQGLPTIQASYLLIEQKTGETVAMMDGGEITRRRTAAASALAADYLARKDAETMTLVGAGALSSHFALAHAAVRPVKRVFIYTRSLPKGEALAAELAQRGLEAHAVTDLEHAVRQSDIVTCVTTSTAPIVKGAWLKPGAHVDLAGAFKPTMRETDGDVVARSSVYVDTREGALAEAGDLLQARDEGKFDFAHVKGDLFDLCRGKVQGRASDEEITLFKSAGTAIEDLATAIMLYQKAR
ncbi:ornithine cyclodeaminase family protein [Aestuariivirga litoralis]|uniref:Ornithine cyclodeaminase family protein n=1 Tax=Aestuariivirga litoralis TaxID=2650924 RepID=A0A2W2BT11_9HYPH|nr:ornithine cyclodeaminase family protein [Aestuariivirga litoralis]PZF76586.1 ornithine cyclodeaminase family protein [Aestuariivirga litoralis]